MHLTTRNVNSAFRTLVEKFAGNGVSKPTPDEWDPEYHPVVRKPSRNGDVLMIEEPVIVTYTHPRERVLFNAARDANPFFHLYEALWMLAGRNDVAPLAYYAKNMANYSDDGKTLNGAYGYRWRRANRSPRPTGIGSFPVDQLEAIVNHLKADPNSRRAVLQMWNVEDDLLKIGNKCLACLDAGGMQQDDCQICGGQGGTTPSKDVCCNLSVMFSLRDRTEPSTQERYLDMTVTNRSNDMIWGMLGANYVHFSFLQEYMAERLGVEVGVYNQFTNNLHVYLDNFQPNEWLKDAHLQDYGFHVGARAEPEYSYPTKQNKFIPLVSYPKRFEEELFLTVERFDGSSRSEPVTEGLTEPFLSRVVVPALQAFECHKTLKETGRAILIADTIAADDWRIACTEWLKRRMK